MTGGPSPPNTILKVVACIPAYNEEKTIGGVVVRAMKYVDRVVVCDGGSTDLTGEVAGSWGGHCGEARAEHGLRCVSPWSVRGGAEAGG